MGWAGALESLSGPESWRWPPLTTGLGQVTRPLSVSISSSVKWAPAVATTCEDAEEEVRNPHSARAPAVLPHRARSQSYLLLCTILHTREQAHMLNQMPVFDPLS